MPRAKKLPYDPQPPTPARALSPARWRAFELRRLRERLEREGFPRLEMSLLVAFTALSGLATSMALRLLGVHAMGSRYALAVCLAYGVFLLLLKAWLRLRQEGDRGDVDVTLDFDFDLGQSRHASESIGGGGEFGGGGATGGWGAPELPEAGDGVADVALGAADGEGCLLLPVLVLGGFVIAALLAAGTVIWGAPALLAELLLDAFLAAGLYRRLRRDTGRWWLETAVRRTAWPFLGTLLLVSIGGFVLQQFVPGADTLGAALGGLRG